MNQRCINFLVFVFIFAAGLTSRPALLGQSTPPQENTAPARFAFGGNAAQIPAQFLGNLIFVPVRVNLSKPFLFELDSNASATSVDPSVLREMEQNGRPSTDTPSSTIPSALRNCVLNLAGVDFPMSVLPSSAKNDFSTQMGMSYRGALGADFFSRAVVVADYSRQTVQLYDPAVFTYSGKGTSFPLIFAGNVALIQAKFVIPGKRALEGKFQIETALNAEIVFSRAYTDAHRISATHFKTIAASYPQIDAGAKVFLGRLKEFQLGPYVIEEPVAAFPQSHPTAGPNVAGSMGGDFLRRFTVIFDYPHHRMILEPNLQVNKFAEEDMSGLSIVAKGTDLKKFEIVQVQPKTAAAAAGIQQGDIIAGIDDEAAADMTLISIRDLFRQVGHKYKLVIDRNGKPLEVYLQMRRLI